MLLSYQLSFEFDDKKEEKKHSMRDKISREFRNRRRKIGDETRKIISFHNQCLYI